MNNMHYTLCLALISLMLRKVYANSNCILTAEQAYKLDPERGECTTLYNEETDTKYTIKLRGRNFEIGCYGGISINDEWHRTQYFAVRGGGYMTISERKLDKPMTFKQEDGKSITVIFSEILPACLVYGQRLRVSESKKITYTASPTPTTMTTKPTRFISTHPTAKITPKITLTTPYTPTPTNSYSSSTPTTRPTKPTRLITTHPTKKITPKITIHTPPTPTPSNRYSIPTPTTSTPRPAVTFTTNPTTEITQKITHHTPSTPTLTHRLSKPTPTTEPTKLTLTTTRNSPTTEPSVITTPARSTTLINNAPDLPVTPCQCPWFKHDHTLTVTPSTLNGISEPPPIHWKTTTQSPPKYETAPPCEPDDINIIPGGTPENIYDKYQQPSDNFLISLDHCTCSCPRSKFQL